MKDQYVGDIGDFEKYSVLRALQASCRLPLVICWMLTEPDGTGEGGKTGYLRDSTRYRNHDPTVFDALEGMIRGNRRSTIAVEESTFLPDATFIREPLVDDRPSRERMLDQVAAAPSPALVFFDPDIGLAGENVKPGGRRSSMYLFHREAGAAFDQGRSLVIYQHFPRVPRPAFLARTFAGLREFCNPAAQFALYSGRVAFLVVPQPDTVLSLRAAAEEIATRPEGLLKFASEHDV